ncbi:hypothetical protein [Niastella populi]|uniref:Uncharacterized protein n=1 Tax=Niastella populi TaxID=550983 RepID=A0A1V9F836_9BACT|nr:hypothetical protein [Niastella populi]OQP54432.1 hypothetical protein A4R26_27540 [Niastella populi]
MLYVILLSIAITASECRDTYLNKVLESQNYGQYYLVIKVNNGYGEKEVVVLNYDLYRYLSKANTDFKDIANYRDFVKDKLNRTVPLNIPNEGLKEINAVYVKVDSTIINAAKKGRAYFVSRFFDVSKKMKEARLKSNVEPEKFFINIKDSF